MISSLRKHLKDMLSGRYQTLSTGRVLSVLFGLFSIVVLSLVIHHMLALKDPSLLHEWVNALTPLTSALFALTGLPYSATKASASITELISALKRRE